VVIHTDAGGPPLRQDHPGVSPPVTNVHGQNT